MIELTTEEPQKNKTHKWRLYWSHASDLDANYPADEKTLADAGYVPAAQKEALVVELGLHKRALADHQATVGDLKTENAELRRQRDGWHRKAFTLAHHIQSPVIEVTREEATKLANDVVREPHPDSIALPIDKAGEAWVPKRDDLVIIKRPRKPLATTGRVVQAPSELTRTQVRVDYDHSYQFFDLCDIAPAPQPAANPVEADRFSVGSYVTLRHQLDSARWEITAVRSSPNGAYREFQLACETWWPEARLAPCAAPDNVKPAPPLPKVANPVEPALGGPVDAFERRLTAALRRTSRRMGHGWEALDVLAEELEKKGGAV